MDGSQDHEEEAAQMEHISHTRQQQTKTKTTILYLAVVR